jgi:hypothetical protein
MMRFAVLFFCCLVLAVSALGFDPPETTWRLESDAYLSGKEGGRLSTAALFRPPELLAYQELRLRIEGKASKRVGYRVEPRFRLDVAPADTFSWVLDQGYGYANLTRTTTLFVGKQRIRWGTGLTWTPTDRLQSAPDPLDPARYLEGIEALRLEQSWPIFSASFIVSPQSGLGEQSLARQLRFGARLYKLVGTADLYLGATHQSRDETSVGFAWSWDVGPGVFYGEAAGLRDQAGKALRFHFTDEEAGIWKGRGVVGFSRQFRWNLGGSVEVFGDEWGLEDKLFRRFRERLDRDLRAIKGELPGDIVAAALEYNELLTKAMPVLGLRRLYGAVSVNYLWANRLQCDAVTIVVLEDGTAYFYPRLSYVAIENLDIMLGALLVAANDTGEGVILPVHRTLEFRFVVHF